MWARLPRGVSSLVGRETSLDKDKTPRLCGGGLCPQLECPCTEGLQVVRGVVEEDLPGKGSQGSAWEFTVLGDLLKYADEGPFNAWS